MSNERDQALDYAERAYQAELDRAERRIEMKIRRYEDRAEARMAGLAAAFRRGIRTDAVETDKSAQEEQVGYVRNAREDLRRYLATLPMPTTPGDNNPNG